MDYSGYGYGFTQAQRLARTLGYGSFAAVEAGVGCGNGLGVLDEHARMAAAHGMTVSVTGFDTGTGLPEPVDFRDMPYLWCGGSFQMESGLRQREGLVLGDIGDTAPGWLAAQDVPVGFVAFDVDYYSSTSRALTGLLTGAPGKYLPRLWCYFDDTVGGEEEIHSEFTGVLAAISEFNAAHTDRKLAQPNGLRWKLTGGTDAAWVEGMYVLHLFSHPRYSDYLHTERDRERGRP